MKKVFLPIVVLAMILLLGSCASSKKVKYFANIDEINLEASRGLYDARIMPKDMLAIAVSTTDLESATPFNIQIPGMTMTTTTLSQGNQSLTGYLVDNDGNINYPVLGKIHVAGLTKTECEDKIRKELKPYMSATENPIVKVRMASFRVTVLGEVSSPGVIPVAVEKISILEAIAQAGDLTMYGKRDNIMLIRENEVGQKSMVRLNINDANLLNSPYYYLQQNDIIYVEPNNIKVVNSSLGASTTLWFSFLGMATSIATLIINILK